MDDRFFTKTGADVHLEDTGQGDPVLAIHGLGGGAYFFHGLAARLRPNRRVVALDLAGTGRSTAGGARFSLQSWADDLADLLERHVVKPAVVLGHSMGTMLALELWRIAPRLVRGLVFAGGLPRVLPAPRERLAARAEQVAAGGLRDLRGWGERIAPGIFSPATMRDAPEIPALWEHVFETQDPAAYVRSISILLAADLEAVVPTVDCPCLAIVGEDDVYAPPDAVGAFIRRLPVTAPMHVISRCGHMPFFEAPAAFAGMVEVFMSNL